MDKLTVAFKVLEKEVRKIEDVSLISFSGEQLHVVYYPIDGEPKIEKINLAEISHLEIK